MLLSKKNSMNIQNFSIDRLRRHSNPECLGNASCLRTRTAMDLYPHTEVDRAEWKATDFRENGWKWEPPGRFGHLQSAAEEIAENLEPPADWISERTFQSRSRFQNLSGEW